MSRTLSSAAVKSMLAQETDEVFLILLAINHASLPATIRVVNNSEDIVSSGNTYLAFPFSLTLPVDNEDNPPNIKLSISGVDRSIIVALRSITTAPTVDISIIRYADPDTIEISYAGYILRNATYTADMVEGDLLIEQFMTEPFPARGFTPSDFPGLF